MVVVQVAGMSNCLHRSTWPVGKLDRHREAGVSGDVDGGKRGEVGDQRAFA
jgi:hypothetical protein